MCEPTPVSPTSAKHQLMSYLIMFVTVLTYHVIHIFYCFKNNIEAAYIKKKLYYNFHKIASPHLPITYFRAVLRATHCQAVCNTAVIHVLIKYQSI